jgi:uncharacterized membrane protein
MTDRSLRVTVVALSTIGAGIAAYLTYAHVTGSPLACATGGCEIVQHSKYSELAGMPVAALGLAGYVALGTTAAFRSDLVRAAGAAFALAGFAFGVYLIYVQVALIDALCQWCLTSDGVLTMLVPVTLLRLRSTA